MDYHQVEQEEQKKKKKNSIDTRNLMKLSILTRLKQSKSAFAALVYFLYIDVRRNIFENISNSWPSFEK